MDSDEGATSEREEVDSTTVEDELVVMEVEVICYFVGGSYQELCYNGLKLSLTLYQVVDWGVNLTVPMFPSHQITDQSRDAIFDCWTDQPMRYRVPFELKSKTISKEQKDLIISSISYFRCNFLVILILIKVLNRGLNNCSLFYTLIFQKQWRY